MGLKKVSDVNWVTEGGVWWGQEAGGKGSEERNFWNTYTKMCV